MIDKKTFIGKIKLILAVTGSIVMITLYALGTMYLSLFVISYFRLWYVVYAVVVTLCLGVGIILIFFWCLERAYSKKDRVET